jgi:hypothetical protein
MKYDQNETEAKGKVVCASVCGNYFFKTDRLFCPKNRKTIFVQHYVIIFPFSGQNVHPSPYAYDIRSKIWICCITKNTSKTRGMNTLYNYGVTVVGRRNRQSLYSQCLKGGCTLGIVKQGNWQKIFKNYPWQ